MNARGNLSFQIDNNLDPGWSYDNNDNDNNNNESLVLINGLSPNRPEPMMTKFIKANT